MKGATNNNDGITNIYAMSQLRNQIKTNLFVKPAFTATNVKLM